MYWSFHGHDGNNKSHIRGKALFLSICNVPSSGPNRIAGGLQTLAPRHRSSPQAKIKFIQCINIFFFPFQLIRNFDIAVANPYKPWTSQCYGIFFQKQFNVILRKVDHEQLPPPPYEKVANIAQA